VTPNLTRALLVAAVLGSTAIAGCASTAGQQSAEAGRQSPAASQQTAGEVVDDSVVTAKVKAKLVDDPVTKAYQINVETVQLSGSVDSAEARSRATQLARDVGGVKDVRNSLQVRKPEG
jgi:osmotically-inducible protein OsmY